MFIIEKVVISSPVSMTTGSCDSLAAILDKKIKVFEAREYIDVKQINSLI